MSNRTHMATVSAKKSGGGKRKLKHMLIRKADDGSFITEKHHEPAEGEEPWNMKPEEATHANINDAADHVVKSYGGTPAAPAPEPEGADEDEDEEE